MSECAGCGVSSNASAASQGNPNECASKATDAKERVLELHEGAETLDK